jgi:hypothetical protein
MNEKKIENLLRKAPAAAAPAGLVERLKKDIRLSRAESSSPADYNPRTWLRRWLPAFSLAAFFIACLVAVGVQTSVISGLNSDNEKLRSSTQNLDQLRGNNDRYKTLLAQSQDLDQLRRDNADLLRLRAEVARLQALAQEAGQLRESNQALLAQLPSTATAAATNDFFSEAKEKAENAKCVNNLKQIGLAARVWSGDNNSIFPTNYLCMSNELAYRWQVLQCPGDHSRNMAGWADVESGNVSYPMLAPGVDLSSPMLVFAYCPIHHNYLMVDGSVQHLTPEEVPQRIKVIEGKTTFVPAQ